MHYKALKVNIFMTNFHFFYTKHVVSIEWKGNTGCMVGGGSWSGSRARKARMFNLSSKL